ncbi:hypothetical protein FHK92_08480 [Pseudomonas brassicacearum subsp. neoaurantiaca]|uniref:Uncharacterized protein n=1 Tax=Pseudomonas brassicacearum subsp. neoaurantiaca TaxID=494916 RepID=A0A7V8UCB8_9PSED|nr:hypothetical protein [Pseudomonas brassicacearum subsp. neoaurantiaca]
MSLIFRTPWNQCGSELARDGVGSVTLALTDTPPSRAGSLPQGPCAGFRVRPTPRSAPGSAPACRC